MGTYENDLKTIISQGRWEAPHVGQLGDAVDTLNRAMSLLAESPGWGGEAAQAASETWVNLQRSFAKVADAAAEVERVNTNAGAALDRAAAAIGELPAGKVPSWIHNTVNAAEAGSMVFIPAMGVSVLASSAVHVFENFLGNQRENEARQASAVLEQELNEYSAQLIAIPWNERDSTLPEPQPIPRPVPVPDPTIRVGGGGGGGYTPSPNPSYDVPAYPGGGSSASGGGSSAPGGGSSASGGGSSAPGIGGSFPSSPTYHSPSIDDGSVGTLPGLSGGSGGGFGAGGMGGAGGYGGGANSGVTAGVLGGATAAGAAALRFGTGAGFGGGGMGGGGLGGGGLAGGVSGTGGLLGAGGAGQGGVGGGSAGAGGGAGSSAGGAGAAGGARGGMMGGQPMGGGAGAGKKDKRPGLGGLMAPKIEDDEPEFIPLPDGARAGGRDQL